MTPAPDKQPKYESCRFAGWTATLDSRELTKGQTREIVEPKTFQVLLLILERAGEVVPHSDFQQRIWPDVSVEVAANLNVRVNQLRAVFELEDPDFHLILTKRRVGYYLNPGVTVEWGSKPAAVVDSGREGDPIAEQAPPTTPEAALNAPWATSIRMVKRTGPVLLLACLLIGLAGYVYWIAVKGSRPPGAWKVSGKTLTILDDVGNPKWSHAFDDFPYVPPRRDKNPIPEVLFTDLDGDGQLEVLYSYFPTIPGVGEVPDSGTTLYCFSSDGKIRWRSKFGSAFMTPGGRPYPASRYRLLLLGRLKAPRPDGGVLVAGGHHAGSWAFEVAIYTASGKKVAEYLHPGWLFDMLIADINGDGVEEILLGGVNNGYGDQDYGATLVVLNSRRVEGQGSVPDGDDRQAAGRVTGKEEAVLLFPEYLKNVDRNLYCRVEGISYGGGILDVEVGKDSDTLPRIYFRLDQNLRLIGVQPNLDFAAQILSVLPRSATYAQRQQYLVSNFGQIKYLRNR